MRALLTAATLVAFVAVALPAALAQRDAPRLTGNDPLPSSASVPSLAEPVTDRGRQMRNYPEQPPVIPHDIEGYQLSLQTNTCLTCHRRQYVEASGAPMVSVTHYQDRDGQMLAEVSGRRYFCTQCHVTQSGAQPLVENLFIDMLEFSAGRK
ncbi:MAG: nitrate reductase cytochrome c-type subunit [Tistlia sp.]|uniref:nitrate reductase cytochrome c-type subunit n=1 Tax=Tistlia sp. TaxID=3057121 RepID=UPI0034A201C3